MSLFGLVMSSCSRDHLRSGDRILSHPFFIWDSLPVALTTTGKLGGSGRAGGFYPSYIKVPRHISHWADDCKCAKKTKTKP